MGLQSYKILYFGRVFGDIFGEYGDNINEATKR